MKYKYQIILLGSLGELSEKIISLFFEKVKELKLPINSFMIIYDKNFESNYSGNQPSFVFYFGAKNGDFKNIDLIDRLVKDGALILPIFYTKDLFSSEIPKILENQNGLLYDVTKDDKIINLALESFGKLRQTRKVFISYRRDESTSVAIQLYEALEKNNFDVFLDTHSIKQGEPFQEELWHRMADCDVIVLLNTPEFLTSRWCKEEIAEASAKKIGIIQLIWPNHKLDNTSEFCFPTQLEESDFEEGNFNDKNKSKLKQSFVDELVMKAESIRARNLASRQDSLITEFTNFAVMYGKKVNLQPERFITEELGKNKRRIFIPIIGIPQSIDCNQHAELKRELHEFDIESIYLIYDDVRIRAKWLNHLDWLNDYLEIKTLKKQNFNKWLQQN
ncbi:toll/interleukin-1 receptor domain-containing protein [Flavobacterium lipolyticum]|uniref:Toll/interleukin-1 receptor domain-containing protein n=1 Tax=Flavobacterium lipolyticum TaxID=2893754 RepID=A0ABS8M246_9FLAO|nr:toll/interleukin-1 receptor domain-containing protein [Flavobacterium sp. F-126]MCC9018894.1 toll/interleukin-1 receptor domain-containing protein [Flavobacterium sp. F-126]